MSDSSDLRTAPTVQVDRISGDADTVSADASAKIAAPFKRGDRIGRYVVLEERGRGGMGVVYAAYDPELDRRVALKLLRPRVMGGVRHTDPEARALLLHEAQSAAKLRHPNVTTVHDVGQTDNGSVFLAMEYVDGQDLRQWLGESPSWREVLDAFIAAGRGLEAAHAAGIIHRDFKPGNVMRDASGQVMVTDFGLAMALRRDEGGAEPSIGRNLVTADSLRPIGEGIVGTPAYMPPEQYKGQTSDERSDVFAFCVSLYEGLYGELPFQGRSIAELMQQVKSGEVEVPKERVVPSWVRRAVLKGLAPEPAERWPSMTPLLAALSEDPGIRRLRAVAIAGGATVLVAIGVALGGAEPDPWCETQLGGIEDTWSPDRRAVIAAAFGKLNATYGNDLWSKTEQRLDVFAKAWSTTASSMCSGSQRVDQRKRLAIQSCLDLRRTDLEVALLLFSEGDREVLDDGVRLASTLGDPADCTNAERPQFDTDGQTDESTREHRVSVGVALRRATLQRFVGKLDEAEKSLRAALEELSDEDPSSLRAQAYLLEASLHRHRGRYAAQHDTLIEALRIALAADDGRLVAETLVDLSHAELHSDSDPVAARQWAHLAGGVVEGIGGDVELEVRVQNAFGAAYINESKWEAARSALLQAQRLAQGAPQIPILLEEALENNLGAAYAAGGDFELALTVFERQVSQREERYGPRHRHLATPLSNIAEAYQRLERYDEALAAATRLAELIEELEGPESPLLVDALGLIARAYSDLDELDEAVRARERAHAIAVEHMDPDAFARFANDFDLIYKYAYIGRFDDAMSLADELVGITTKSKNGVRLAKALVARSEARRRHGDGESALADANEAVAILGRDDAKPADVSEAHYERGLSLIELGRGEEALAALDHALAAAQPEPTFFTAKNIGHRGRALQLVGRYEEATAAFEAAISYAESHGPRRDICWARMLLARMLGEAKLDEARAVRLARLVAEAPEQDEETETCRVDAKRWLEAHETDLRPGSERDKVRAP